MINIGIGVAWKINRKVSDGSVPVNTVAPVISGTAAVGNVLTYTTGTWTSDTGVTGYLYQWTRDGVNIASATSSTYTLVTADLTKTILCKVAATDSDGTSAYVNSNSLVIYDSNYLAVLNYAITQGYGLPTLLQRIKQSNLLTALKAANVWDKLDTFACFATDGSTQFALIDWKRLVQYNASTGPTFIANQGFTGNATSSYINTNFNPAIGTNNYVLNNASRHIFVRNQSTAASTLDGVSSGNSNASVGVNTTLLRINQGATSIPTSADYSGSNVLKSIHRTSATNIEIFVGTTQTSKTFTSVSVASESQLILARGVLSPPPSTGSYGGSQISMYSMGANLVAENTAYVNAFNTYINSLV